jgi:hypothetical protein
MHQQHDHAITAEWSASLFWQEESEARGEERREKRRERRERE